MKKENIYIDLSKCSEDEQKHIFSLLPEAEYSAQYSVLADLTYLQIDSGGYWETWKFPEEKTELTYPEFIKLFEGGDGENGGWIKIESEADLPKKEVDVHFIFTDEAGKYQTFGVWDNRLKSFYSGALKIENVIYYQPLIKPEPPKF